MSSGIWSPVPLDVSHDVESFDCGVGLLNDFIRQRAQIDGPFTTSRTYVYAGVNGRLLAYCSLRPGAVEAVFTRDDIRRRERRRVVPVIVIARIAVEVAHQCRGLGTALLEQVILGCDRGAVVFGARAAVATTSDERARSFFQGYGFEPFPDDAYLLFLPLDVSPCAP
jgi:GNAT superfamily N-acetyltransferase